uniref:Putative secreted protein n=1 Tax=Ixodes ricinus TaxID=34613 RepID=A0A6B0TVJ0_IXORI
MLQNLLTATRVTVTLIFFCQAKYFTVEKNPNIGEEIEEWRSLAATPETNAVRQTNPLTALISAFAAVENDGVGLLKYM